ncbi:class I SAM-dependent methyltransferase [Acidithiobacillus sp. IBUN Pt1247-S3]|uniref:class I SAM-dependent methyltransferase n=1 Tax=Acidithiobacillus sp. IBUN Pt1247-S3 TaxID=3166642 RepID=UPI0034E5CD78
MQKNKADLYKKSVSDIYSSRSKTYDSSENSAWHELICKNLVDLSGIRPGSRVLDVATGTGMLAFYAASKVVPDGTVIGIDISEYMINKAKSKIPGHGMGNICFEVMDGENIDHSSGSFDFIFCSSALVLMTNIVATLTHWKKFLNVGGKVCFNAFSENSFINGVVAQSVLRNYGVNYEMNNITGTAKKCRTLLELSGFKNIEVKTENYGCFISLEDAKKSWISTSYPAPGQFPHPLACLTQEQLSQVRQDYEREMETLHTKDGIWNDMTTFYAIASD